MEMIKMKKKKDLGIILLGHVDTGKSHLFEVLTGFNPDVLEEEKKSGGKKGKTSDIIIKKLKRNIE
jgi:selenocysteine-specific translation elongation factor